jgi:hypothetical protein
LLLWLQIFDHIAKPFGQAQLPAMTEVERDRTFMSSFEKDSAAIFRSLLDRIEKLTRKLVLQTEKWAGGI